MTATEQKEEKSFVLAQLIVFGELKKPVREFLERLARLQNFFLSTKSFTEPKSQSTKRFINFPVSPSINISYFPLLVPIPHTSEASDKKLST